MSRERIPPGHKRPAPEIQRAVRFQGSNVLDEWLQIAIFQDLSSSPATMEASHSLDAIACFPGFAGHQADAIQACVQVNIDESKVETYVRIPREFWPDEWIRAGLRGPVIKSNKALYGHPDSGALWEKHCEPYLIRRGLEPVLPASPSVYHRDGLDLPSVVYANDFKMAGPAKNLEKGWKLIRRDISMDDPEPVNLCLGCHHREYTETINLQSDNNRWETKK